MRDARGTRRYVAWGDLASRLTEYLRFHQGMRARIERMALGAAYPLVRTGSPVVRDVAACCAAIQGVFGTRSSAFMLYTGWYKESVLVGPVLADDGTRHFVKAFGAESAARAESVRAAALADLLPSSVLIPATTRTEGALVAYELIAHGRRNVQEAGDQRLADFVSEAYSRGAPSSLQFDEVVDCERLERLPSDVRIDADGIRRLLEWAEGRQVVFHAAHGDLTPWNVLVGQANKIYLVDFDEVGPAPALSDWFHWVTHADIVAGRKPVIGRCGLVPEGLGLGGWAGHVAAYLLHQLSRDAARADRYGLHRSLRRQVSGRLSLAEYVAEKLQ